MSSHWYSKDIQDMVGWYVRILSDLVLRAEGSSLSFR